jgi:hypothetical protein
MDTIAHFVDDFVKCTYFLMDFGDALGYRDCLPLKIVELYVILLPFYDCIGALEWRACALPDIVPFSCEPLAILGNIFSLLATDKTPRIFHELHIRLFARLRVSNPRDTLAAYTLTL